MKKLLSILCVLAFGTAQAQYFQNLNGTPAYDYAYDGVNITAGGQGHLIAGVTQTLGGQDLLLTRTNINGTIGGGNTFNQVYRLTTAGGIVLSTYPCKILQVASGRICVVGSYYDPTSVVAPGIFTAVLQANGAVFNVRGWQTTIPGPSTNLSAISACRALAAASNNIYIIGYTDAVVGSVNGVRPIIIAINGSTNALIWSRLYDFLPAGTQAKVIASDIVASPYLPTGVNELFIVGTYYDVTGFDAGFTFRVNVANGNPIGLLTSFDSGRNDQFTAVCVATGAGGGTNGFAITGSTNVNGDWDAITFKTDPVGSGAAWITLQDYTGGGDNFGTDIIQRQNTFGQWFYYAAGTAVNGSQGGSDMVVYFVDDLTGNAPREYTYGTTANENCEEISSFTGTVADGITMFGNGPGAVAGDPNDEYYVKAYYNAISGCNEAFVPHASGLYPVARTQFTVTRVGAVGPSNFLATIPAFAAVNVLCFNVTIATGSNARTAETQETNVVSSTLYPNPVSLSAPVLNLNLNSPTEQQIEIRITDMLGREVLNQQITITEGQSLQQVQLPSGLSAGVYNMSISGNNVSENHRFVLE
ncbi:MAG: T9SS type A sorting domain-containing protein [Bacteroidota bacterium]